MYEIRYVEGVADDLKKLRPAQRRRILDRIDAQLTHQPTEQTRNRFMKVINLERASLDSCIKESQRERVVLKRAGKPVALMVGVEGLDEEQLQLGTSDRFWKLIGERRSQRAMSRAELEKTVSRRKSRNGQQSKQAKRP